MTVINLLVLFSTSAYPGFYIGGGAQKLSAEAYRRSQDFLYGVHFFSKKVDDLF